ncbi:DNA polymerase III subunit delta' [Chryseobacterium sp.]|uniref:DNA polymerase III subunit n=1 Tax=Chryseobacterium sp. TaxID=1871047 RepID=UPI0025BD60DB|nr:DNA polymerase III subunit delta' [Chryseobacterium sp.]
MNWENIAGQENLKKLLKDSIAENRVSHAQLFVGKEGYGTLPLALAYAREILKDENEHAAAKVEHLNHLDLHFSFPVYTDNKNSLSKNKFEEFREMILQSPYASYDDWTAFLDSENKQLFISADEIDDQNQKFSLKSYEGGTKILIVWRADKMNVSASNKFLKFLEEPPAKTIILLTAENTNDILPTILSRTQVVEVPRIQDEDLQAYLQKEYNTTEEKSREIVHEAQGNLNEAIKLLKSGSSHQDFEKLFIQWVRDAFQVKKKPEFLKNIIFWAREIAGWNRERQKNFLDYCSEIFRLALLQNYQSEELVYKKINANGFNWESFSRFISGANIESILEEINTADLHLTRNGNPKIIWTDLGIKLSRYIHKN